MAWAPDRGDLAWVSLDPQAGREQKGRRPVLVLSPRRYNALVGLCLVCPITSKAKGYPFEVPLPSGLEIDGVVLADQVKSLDWRERRATLIAHIPPAITAECAERAMALLDPDEK